MSSASTETILNSFPIFGHTGWSALQYAGTFYDIRNRANTTSGSFESISTSSMYDENSTPPTTADTQPTGFDLSPPIVFKHEVKTQKRGKGTFLNHTPRSYETQTSRTMDAYKSLGHSREKHSCHRMFGCAMSVNESTIFASPCGYSPSAESCQGDYKISVLPATPVELDSKEVASPSSRGDHLLPAKPIQCSSSVPVARALKYEPRVALPSGYTRYEVGGWSMKPQINHSPDRKYSGRRVSFKVTAPDSRSTSHASLEPLSTKNRRKASCEVLGELPQKETKQIRDVAVFGVTQEYLDSQVGEPFSTSEIFHAYSSDSREVLVPELPKRSISAPVKKQYASYAAEESDMREALPALLYRGPKSVTPSGFPFHIASSLPAVSENSSLDQGQDTLSRKIHIRNDEDKVRGPKYPDVGKSGQTDHPPVGRLAPPILSHEALTANANLGLNDLSYYLKHTGPSPTESKHPKLRQRKRSIKFFGAKERKKQASAHQGSSSQRLAKQTPINPAWVREMKTSGGVRHLRIVIPATENECDMTVEPVPALPVQGQQHIRHVSSNGFEEDTLCPPENSAVQHILYGSSEAAMRSFSEPHMTYQEQARARKLRDLQHAKRKLVPDSCYSGAIREKYRDSFVDVPACTTDVFHDAIMHAHDDESFEEEDSVRKTERLEERVMVLQRQNMRLMEALARIVGVVLEHDDLDCETVMRASLRAQMLREL